MAILFTLPSHLWNTFSNSNGVNLKCLIKMIKEDRNDKDKIDHMKKLVQAQMIMSKSKYMQKCYRTDSCGRLTLLLFIIKLLFLINAIGQLFFLINFFSLKPTDMHIALFNHESSKVIGGLESMKFPRVVMCDFMIRELGSNQHWYSVQCNLPINIFNEAIFMGILIWLMILIILNGTSIILWIISLIERNRKKSIIRSLRFYENLETKISEEHSQQIENDFVHHIGLDGFILLRIIGKNIDDIFMIEMIGYLYTNYVQTLAKTEKLIV